MTKRRFVDPHVHLWDVHLHPSWYRSFPKAGDNVLGWKMTAPWQEHFLWQEYSESVSAAHLVKWVHVTAVDAPEYVEAETAWIATIARESAAPPYAIVGSIDPNLSARELEAKLERQMAHPGYRGLRILGQVDRESAAFASLLKLLAARGLIYDVAADASAIDVVVKCLARHPDLTVVLEHTGLPHGTSREAFAEWSRQIAKLAALPNTYCKLSGLVMTIHYPEPEFFRMFFDECIRLFGPERCMFGTNFPVDLTYGPGTKHLAGFEAVAERYSVQEADSLFAGTAEKVYRL